MSDSTRRNDVIVLLAMIPLLCVGLLAADRASEERERRIRCAQNLKQIGLAMQLYANENKGTFPRTKYDLKTPETIAMLTGVHATDPFKDDGPKPNDVTAPMWLVLRNGDITSDVFNCPSSTAERFVFGAANGEKKGNEPGEINPVVEQDAKAAQTRRSAPSAAPTKPAGPPIAGKATELSNFPDMKYISYSSTNCYPSEKARTVGFKWNYTLASDFALVSDLNPGAGAAAIKPTDMRPGFGAPGGRAAVGNTDPIKFTEKMKQANSPNHGGFGQNVLYADGHVEWTPTPFCGSPRPINNAPRDNIFTREMGAEAKGDPILGPPMDQYDSVMLPVAPKKEKPAGK